MNAVDTNVFVYSLDDTEPVKRPKATVLLSKLLVKPAETIIPWQVAGELLNRLRKWEIQGRITNQDVIDNYRNLVTLFPFAIPNIQVFKRYFNLHSRYSLSHWDAMLLAACQEAGVTTLYSEDLQASMDYDGVVIVNPFA